MKSWAVTRGPSLDPDEKRLAVHVEDHPIEYNTFEGTIPQGEYGGGTVMIWDRGRWLPEGDPHKGYAKGHLVFDLDGEKLHGRWHLVRMRARDGDRHDNWLLIKGKDEGARGPRDKDILEEQSRSAVTGRSIEEIAAGKGGRKRVWHSNRGAGAETRWKTSCNPRRQTPQASKASRPKRSAGARSRSGRAKAAALAVARIGGEAGGARTPGRKARGSARVCSAQPRHALRQAAERPGMAARDQVRRLSHGSAARSRQGAASDAQASRTGRTGSSRSRRRLPRFPPRPRCSTAKWSWRTSAASAVSRCCRRT